MNKGVFGVHKKGWKKMIFLTSPMRNSYQKLISN